MNSTELSIENIDKQIEKLTNNYDDTLEITPVISKSDLIQKIRIKEMDQKVGDSKDNSLNITCKLDNVENISRITFSSEQPFSNPKKQEELEEEMRRLYDASSSVILSNTDSILKDSFDSRELLIENDSFFEGVFDINDSLSILVKRLFTCFSILLTFVILFIMFICVI